MLVTNRPRGFPMQDHHTEDDTPQGSLFAPDPLARPPGQTPDPFAPPARQFALPPDDGASVAPPADRAAVDARTDDPPAPPDPTAFVPPADDMPVAPEYVADPEADELVAPPEPIADPDPATHAARRRAAPLAGPTLDDVMSRVWEGLRAEVPTPCPVCHTEIESSMHGRCGACGSALD
jgi:hypothetical protein